jgi:hypothetical protein
VSRPSTDSLLARALELLQLLPLDEAPAALRTRVRHLLDDAGVAVAPEEAPTASDKPRLFPVHVSAPQRYVLELALTSERLAGTFSSSVRDFLLVAARGYDFQPPPELRGLRLPAGLLSTVYPFTPHELADVRARAVNAGVASLDRYILGCAFAFLCELQMRWPDDTKLNSWTANRVPVIHYGKAAS